MDTAEVVVGVYRQADHCRQTSFGAIHIRGDWLAEVVSGVEPQRVAGVEFYPCVQAETRSRAIARLVNLLRCIAHTPRIRIVEQELAVR
jgi:hypothetical protein